MRTVSLSLAEDQFATLQAHLFPGDGLEAVAFLACGRARGPERERLVVREVHLIEHQRCERTPRSVHWQAEDIETLLYRAELEGLSLVKVHSHPGGYPQFSSIDDESDAELLPTIRSWTESDAPHGSVVMLPCGRMFGRYLWDGNTMQEIDLINVVGPTLRFFWAHEDPGETDLDIGESQDQAFGAGTTRQMRRLRIGIVGASGTGSPTIEQFLRLGAGHLMAVDDDKVEKRNLNRILFATRKQAEKGIPKVVAAKEDIERKNLGTNVTIIEKPIETPEAIRAIAQCDVLFGCVDTASARFTMNLIASHYILPYFDIGVLLDAERDEKQRGTIRDILGTVHYLVPGRSSLLTRDAFTLEDVRAEGLHKRDPAAAAQQVAEKYLRGVRVSRPAVVSVNMFASSLAVNDFLARLHPYRKAPNKDVASIEFSLGELRLTADEEMETCPVIGRFVGFGDRCPLLGLPEYGE
jgi:hypothetical protein